MARRLGCPQVGVGWMASLVGIPTWRLAPTPAGITHERPIEAMLGASTVSPGVDRGLARSVIRVNRGPSVRSGWQG